MFSSNRTISLRFRPTALRSNLVHQVFEDCKELVSLFLEGHRRLIVSHDALRSEKEKPARIENAAQRLGGYDISSVVLCHRYVNKKIFI